MRRTIPQGLLCSLSSLLSLSMACNSNKPEPTPTSEAPRKTEPERPLTNEACANQIADYLAKRKQLSRCVSDSDCAEMWPGLCPHGPYYIHRDSDIASVVAHERAITTNCEIPDCEPPIELGIAHCEQGTCVPGRTPPGKGEENCWDYRETWLEADGFVTATTSSTIERTTPRIAIAPATAGELVLEIEWPADCGDCGLLISERDSAMSVWDTVSFHFERSSTGEQRNGKPIQREFITFPITPGPYYMVAKASKDATFTMRAELRDVDGQPPRVTRHGVVWQRKCEG